MAALVSAEDFSTFLGIPLPPVESLKRKQMDMFLNDASDWAREIARRAWTLPTDAPPTVTGIIKAACRREWNNPKRVAYLVKGPQSASFIQGAYPPEFFTEAEERKLQSYKATGQLWTQGTYREEPAAGDGYLGIYPHGGFMPWSHPLDAGYEDSVHF